MDKRTSDYSLRVLSRIALKFLLVPAGLFIPWENYNIIFVLILLVSLLTPTIFYLEGQRFFAQEHFKWVRKYYLQRNKVFIGQLVVLGLLLLISFLNMLGAPGNEGSWIVVIFWLFGGYLFVLALVEWLFCALGIRSGTSSNKGES